MKNQISSKSLFISLGILQLFISIAAIPAGIGFILDPSGEKLGISMELIKESPFANYFIPGVILLIVNGIGSLIGSLHSFFKHKRTGIIAITLGIALVIWIVSQVYWIGLVSWLQPFIFVMGILEIILATKVIKMGCDVLTK